MYPFVDSTKQSSAIIENDYFISILPYYFSIKETDKMTDRVKYAINVKRSFPSAALSIQT